MSDCAEKRPRPPEWPPSTPPEEMLTAFSDCMDEMFAELMPAAAAFPDRRRALFHAIFLQGSWACLSWLSASASIQETSEQLQKLADLFMSRVIAKKDEAAQGGKS